MKFLANENMPRDVVDALRARGQDVEWIRETAPGSPDPDVLASAARNHRILLTFDKDFGELAYRAELPGDCGIILFRLPMPQSAEAGQRLSTLILSRVDWAGRFSVIETGRIRMRDLPARS